MVAVKVFRRALQISRAEGMGYVARRLALRASNWAEVRFRFADLEFPLREEDVTYGPVCAKRTERQLAEGVNRRIGWVCIPPSIGSGGHTTLFRMVAMAERQGHTCTIFLYDKSSEDVSRHEESIRLGWPQLKAEIKSARPEISDVDHLVAGSWETAHVAAARTDGSIPLSYFVQDFEPFFVPRGPLWALAEETYRFGFNVIALGEMVTSCLRAYAGVEPQTVVPFGCDTTTYHLVNRSAMDHTRKGVVFYAKRGPDRRGYELSVEALKRFHNRFPEEPIHVVGDAAVNLGFSVHSHGILSPSELNEIYNSVRVGMALSFTNISLVAEEMMASGVVPLVNDSPLARADLPHDGPLWADPTPRAMAEALSTHFSQPYVSATSRNLAARVRSGWDNTAESVIASVVTSEMSWGSHDTQFACSQQEGKG